jgi:hypothetical protein
MPTTETLRATVERYAATVTARNADAYAFMQRSIDGCEAMLFEVTEVHPVVDKAAIAFHITLTLEGGAIMHIRGIEVFTVADDGLITAVDAYWGDQDVTFD